MLAPLFLDLGALGLINPDEGRYAEIAREMVTTGDWVVPRLNGAPHWAKPPFAAWAAGASLQTFGMNEVGARVPTALLAAACVIAVFLMGRAFAGTIAGLLSALVLSTMFEFTTLARTVTPDMPQCAFVTAALGLLFFARPDPADPTRPWRRGRVLAAGVLLGLAFFDKGPVGLGVLATTTLTYFLLGRCVPAAGRPKVRWISPFLVLGFVVLIAAIGLPWFLVVTARHPLLADHFLKHEVTDRVLSNVHGRAQTWWFFFAVLAGGLMPWLPLALTACGAALRRLRQTVGDAPAAAADRWLLAAIIGPFLMFEFSRSKLWTYMLPLYPAFALLVGRMAATWLTTPPSRSVRRIIAVSWWLPAVCIVGVAGFGWLKLGSAWDTLLPHVGISLAVNLAAWLVVRYQPKHRRPTAAVGGIGIAGAVALHAVLVGGGALDENFYSKAPHAWVHTLAQTWDFRGAPLHTGIRPSGIKPVLPTGVNRFVGWKVGFESIPFYAFGSRPECFVIYGKEDVSSYEIEADVAMDIRPDTDDLLRELRGPDRTFVFLRAENLATLRELTGLALPAVGSAPTPFAKHETLIVSNR